MKKSFFLFIIVTVLCSSSFGQPFTTYQTFSAVVNNGVSSSSSVQYERTIGMYPERTVTCYEVDISGSNIGYVTIALNTQDANTYLLYPIIMIRDMVQRGNSDTVYFCGTRRDVQYDSVGVMGYFLVDASGQLHDMNYIDIVEVGVLTDLVVVSHGGRVVTAAIGKKKVGGVESYYLAKAYKSSIVGNWEYDIAPLPERDPVDIVATDGYVAVVSTDHMNKVVIRKFLLQNLDDGVRDTRYEYNFAESVPFGPMLAFVGQEGIVDGENRVAMSFMGLRNNIEWRTYLKIVDLDNMSIVNSQSHHMSEKNFPMGITYLSKYKQVALLEFFDPDYQYICPTVVLFDPNRVQNYFSGKLWGNSNKDWHSLSSLRETATGSGYFVCGGVVPSKIYYQTHDAGTSTPSVCINRSDIAITMDQAVNPVSINSPLTQSHSIEPLHYVTSSYQTKLFQNKCFQSFE